MTLEIKRGDASPIHKNIFTCIYGEPGNRKTSWAITAEDPLLLDFDQRGHRAFDAKKAARIDVTSFDDIGEAVSKFSKRYKTLIIDTAGRAIDSKSQEIIAASKKSPNMKAHNPFGGLSLPGYGILKVAFYEVVGLIRNSGMHCVFVCHGKRSREGDILSWEPDVVGSSAEEIYKVCDLMGLMSPINGRTGVRFNPSENWQAKNPLGLTTLFIDKKDEPGWEVTLKELIDRASEAVNKTNESVELPQIVKDAEACTTVESANAILSAIMALPDSIEKDMATAAFKAMRKKNGFNYSKEKGVY